MYNVCLSGLQNKEGLRQSEKSPPPPPTNPSAAEQRVPRSPVSPHACHRTPPRPPAPPRNSGPKHSGSGGPHGARAKEGGVGTPSGVSGASSSGREWEEEMEGGGGGGKPKMPLCFFLAYFIFFPPTLLLFFRGKTHPNSRERQKRALSLSQPRVGSGRGKRGGGHTLWRGDPKMALKLDVYFFEGWRGVNPSPVSRKRRGGSTGAGGAAG